MLVPLLSGQVNTLPVLRLLEQTVRLIAKKWAQSHVVAVSEIERGGHAMQLPTDFQCLGD